MDTEVDATMIEEPELYTLEEEEVCLNRAVRLANTCDVVVACVGGSASTSREAIFKNNSSGDNDTGTGGATERTALPSQQDGKTIDCCLCGRKAI